MPGSNDDEVTAAQRDAALAAMATHLQGIAQSLEKICAQERTLLVMKFVAPDGASVELSWGQVLTGAAQILSTVGMPEGLKTVPITPGGAHRAN